MSNEQFRSKISLPDLQKLLDLRNALERNEQLNEALGFEPGQLTDNELETIQTLREIPGDPYAGRKLSPRQLFIFKGNREQN